MKKLLLLSILTILVVSGFLFYNLPEAEAWIDYGYNYNNCTYHAYRLCVGNSIYWFSSCGEQQDIYQSCYGINQICQYGECTYQYQQPYINPAPAPTYVAHYRTACYGKNVYWYDSLGTATGLYKTCQDANSCTTDSCSSSKCQNTLKCDGSTCAINSSDYAKYCQSSPSNIDNNNTVLNGLTVSISAKQDASASQWSKSIQVNANSTSYFMISVVNNSSVPANNIIISANIPGQITSIGNIQINGLTSTGDIISGINIGTLAQGATDTITFEGKTQAFSSSSTTQAAATININGAVKSDSMTLDFNPNQSSTTAAVSSTSAATGFWAFLKRWYLWILVALFLIFLFVVVFRRLSSET